VIGADGMNSRVARLVHASTAGVGGPPIPNIVRRPYGPGWALVGDAGYLKDFGTAQGISDAFRDADLLATALHDTWTGTQTEADAMASYETGRDQAAMPMYELTAQFAALDPQPPEMRALFAALTHNPDQTDRFFGVFAGSVQVGDFFSPDNLSAILAQSRELIDALHGRRARNVTARALGSFAHRAQSAKPRNSQTVPNRCRCPLDGAVAGCDEVVSRRPTPKRDGARTERRTSAWSA
jgi:hypothetical protein